MKTETTHIRELRGQFVKYVPLNMLGMLALSFYIMADTFFVANGVGESGLTALNLVLPAYSLISGLGRLFGMGGATKYAICKGAGHQREANEIFTETVLLCVGSGALIMLAGLFFAPQVSALLGADSTIAPLAVTYLGTVMPFAIVFILNSTLVCFVRNDGDPKCAMLAMLVGSLGNVVLDYIFIFPLGWGMFGAAIATCMAPVMGLVVLLFHFLSKKNSLRLCRPSWSARRVREIFSVGFSPFITEFSTGIVMLVFNLIILSLSGNIGVAAYGVVANINLLAMALFSGIAEGVQPLVSGACGRGESASVKALFRWSAGLAVLLGLALYVVLFLLARPVIALFNGEDSLRLAQIAEQGIRLYFPLLCLSGVNIVTAAVFAAMSKAGPSFAISITRSIAVIVVLGLLFSRLLGMAGVWLAAPCTELITLVLCVFLLRKKRGAGERDAN